MLDVTACMLSGFAHACACVFLYVRGLVGTRVVGAAVVLTHAWARACTDGRDLEDVHVAWRWSGDGRLSRRRVGACVELSCSLCEWLCQWWLRERVISSRVDRKLAA